MQSCVKGSTKSCPCVFTLLTTYTAPFNCYRYHCEQCYMCVSIHVFWVYQGNKMQSQCQAHTCTWLVHYYTCSYIRYFFISCLPLHVYCIFVTLNLFFFNLNLTYVIFSMPKHLYVFKKEKKTLCRKKIHIEIILLISNFVLAVLQIWTVCSEIVYQQGTM